MMRRASKIWLIVGFFLVIVGLGLFTAAMMANRWDFSRLSTTEFETNIHEIRENVHSIAMDTDTAGVRVVPSEDGMCKVVCRASTKDRHTIKVEEGMLTVTQTDDREWYDYIGIHLGETMITVYLPEGEYTALVIRGSTGNVEIPRGFHFSRMEIIASTGDVENAASAAGEMKIKTSTGDIHVESVTAGTLDLSVSTGKITAESIDCEGEFMLHVSTGKADLIDVMCGSLISVGSTGDISMRDVNVEASLSVERSTGNIRLDMCDAAELSLKTSTGDVSGTLLSEKVFITRTSTGDVEVPETMHGGKCEITTNTGDIQIRIG